VRKTGFPNVVGENRDSRRLHPAAQRCRPSRTAGRSALCHRPRVLVPNIRQALYSDVLVALAAEPQQAAIGPDDDKASTPVARGLPGSWDEIAPGHLVIAQESLANGWWEAIVLDRKDDMLTLRFRDFPRLPRFFRHRTAVALVSPANAQA
jgi:hypothetical protein